MFHHPSSVKIYETIAQNFPSLFPQSKATHPIFSPKNWPPKKKAKATNRMSLFFPIHYLLNRLLRFFHSFVHFLCFHYWFLHFCFLFTIFVPFSSPQLDNYEIKSGKCLKINVSVPNLRLFVGNIPKSKGKEEILDEFGKLTGKNQTNTRIGYRSNCFISIFTISHTHIQTHSQSYRS